MRSADPRLSRPRGVATKWQLFVGFAWKCKKVDKLVPSEVHNVIDVRLLEELLRLLQGNVASDLLEECVDIISRNLCLF